METKEIVRANLIKCRKEKKITQLELSELINYSDKAISRWENGEVVPDIPTLDSLAKVYDVPIAYFFEMHTTTMEKFRFTKLQIGNKLAISLLSVLCVWFIATIIFFYTSAILNVNYWMAFIWAVPLSAIVGIIFNGVWGKRSMSFLLISVLIWSLLTAVFLELIQYKLYLVFILGIPMQVGIILWSCIKPKNNIKNKSLH